MKKPLLFILSTFLLLAGQTNAQTIRIGAHDAMTSWTSTNSGITSQSEVKQVIQQILDAVNVQANFKVQAANIPNAAAVTYGGQRYILYNPRFFNDLTAQTGTRWAPISILAHEVGHHVNGHTPSANQPQLELQADEFSGYVLRRMGASLDEAEVAMRTAGNVRASATHPAGQDRLVAIENGWQRADQQMGGTGIANNNRTARTQTEYPAYSNTYPTQSRSQSTAMGIGNILGELIFNSSPNSRYYITSGLSLVKMFQNGVATIAKLTPLKNGRFAYLITDAENTQLLVDKKGNVLTRAGQVVGILRGYK